MDGVYVPETSIGEARMGRFGRLAENEGGWKYGLIRSIGLETDSRYVDFDGRSSNEDEMRERRLHR